MASSGDFLRAVNWMVKSGVTIINASITSQSENPVVVYALQMLSHGNVILVAVAGNRGPDGPPAYPAAIESALAVTAVSPSGDPYRHANTGDYIDIAAPGIDLPTDGELYRFDVNHPDTNGMIEYFIRPMSGIRCNVSRTEHEAFARKESMSFRRKAAGVVTGPIRVPARPRTVLRAPRQVGSCRRWAIPLPTPSTSCSPGICRRCRRIRRAIFRAAIWPRSASRRWKKCSRCTRKRQDVLRHPARCSLR